jgi:hypothetical protein
MTSEPGQDPPPQSRTGALPGADEENEECEAFGMIVLTRHVKPDGRALILYTRRPDEPA